MVNIPDVKGREEVLKVHCKGKLLAGDVDLKVVAQTTSGFTPADLENLMNEAALLTARYNKPAIDMEEIRRAFVKVGIGTEKKSRVISEREKRMTAYHEAGHAIIHELLPDLDPTYMVSVIPTGQAGGYTMSHPGEDKSYITKSYFKQRIISLFGGRAAEEIKFNEITTGASNDIERATDIARKMVTRFGMSDSLGPMQFGDDSNEVFIGRDLAHARNYGENVATQIDLEIKRIIDDSYTEALRLVEEYMDVVDKIVDALMAHERITGKEVRELFPEGVLTEKVREGMMTEGFASRDFPSNNKGSEKDIDDPEDWDSSDDDDSDDDESGKVVDVTIGDE
jgi:cell division protease FtsH